MAIPLGKEDDELAKQFWGAIEVCYFCGSQTKYWHENTNNPVCQGCAKKHKVAELPDFGRRIRAAKRKAARAA